MNYFKNPTFLLILIVLTFLFREIFLAGVFPLFTGQDEARHYNTVQWLSEEQDPACVNAVINNPKQNKEDLSTYRFSQEIREISAATNLSTWREENYRKQIFNPGNLGSSEALVRSNTWTKDMPCPPDIVSQAKHFSFFHWLGNTLERFWERADILTRFYLVRTLSVVLGTLTILFTYFVAKEVGLSSRIGLLLALILSLQPRFSIYTTNINYDVLLIPCFAFFLWTGIRCLQRGFTPANLTLVTLAFGCAVLTKGISLVLLAGVFFLVGLLLFQKRNLWKQVPLLYWSVAAIVSILLVFLISSTYNISSLFPQFSFPSLNEYLEKSLPRIPSSSENFWGTISWNSATFGPIFVYVIWCIEALALVGLIRFFYRKEKFSFLPTKSIVFFLLTLIIALQTGVRFYDWNVFQNTGTLALGTPGRYFLPTLLPQLLLIAVGLGALLRQKVRLERALIALALIMLAFNLYTVWLIIIPRFYL